MRKLKLFFACLLMTVLSIGQVWGAEELKATLDFTSNEAWQLPVGSGNGITTATDYSDGNYTVNLSATTKYYFNSDGYLMIGKSGSKITLPAFSWKTTKIVVTGRTGASTGTKQNIYVGETAVSTETTGCTGANTYNIASANQAAGNVYVFQVTSNHNAQVTKIEIYGEASAAPDPDPVAVTVTGVTLDQSEAEVAVGKTITLTPTVAPSNATTKTVTWESDDEDVATVDGGVVTGVAEGTATITVKTTDGNKTATCEVTVTAAPAAVNYEKVTAEPEDWSGEYLLVYEANATTARVWKGVDEANNYAEATIATGVIAAPEGAAVLTIAKVAESDPVVYTIQVGTKYIGQTSNSNGIKIQDAAINNSLSMESNGVGIVASEAHLRYNSASSSYFRYYKSSTYSSQNPIQLYKKADGKQNTGLAYAEADQKKLTKLGDAFTAPTLQNPNNLTGITYASSDATVVEVNSSTGAIVEIKKAGVVVITASRAEDDTYKAGSASYTIGVTTHAGTEADPYVAADAKIAIDAMGTVENAYATGIVSKVVTVTLPNDGYITFDFSADGATTGQQIEAYKCYGLNSAAFEAVSDVVTGATVVVTGNLKKYNSTYEFDQNCHLVSYEAPEVPKTHIANDQANPYTVAQAITFAADGVTYDLDDYVYVQGVVYDVKSFNTTNGTLDIYIKDAGQENQFELFKCAGINDGSATTPFEALTDVQEGDEVIAYGQLTVYNAMSELKSGNYLVELTRPEVAVTSVAMTESTAEVEVGSTVTLHASILPENATNKAITWSVQSGSDYASVDAGVVTGNAEGEAVIRAASTADPTKYAECTVTVTAVDPTKHVVTFDATADKTTEDTELSLTKGDLTIAITDGDGRFNNETDYRVYKNAEFTVSCANGNITKIEMTCTAGNDATGFEDAEGLVQATGTWTGNAASVSLIASVKQVRIETITITYKEDNRLDAGLAYAEAAINKVIDDDAFINPLTNTNSVDVTYETSDDQVAEVANDGTVTIIGEGTATITASFAGDATYKPANVSYTITVSAAPLTDYYEKVTETAGIVEGTYLIVYEDGENSLAFNGGLETLDAESNTIAVTITNDNKIGVTEQTAAATFYIDPAAGTVKSASNHYIGVSSWSNGLKQTDTYVHNVLEIDGDGNAQVGIYKADWNTTGGTMRLQYNKGAGQTRFRYFKNGGQQSIALYKLANEVIKPEAGLAWDPSDDIELTVGDAFTAPTLLNPNSIDATEITIESSNTDVATVDGEGVVSLVAEATGTTTITATFTGNASYKPATISYTITVNAVAPTPAETKNVVIIAEYNSKFYAMTNSLSSGALAAVEVEKDGDQIVVFAEADKAAIQWTMTDNTATATFQDADDKYLAHSGTGTNLALQADAEDWTWHTDGYYYAVENRTFFYNNSGVFKNYSTSNLPAEKTDYSGAPEIIEIAAEDIILSQKEDPQLAYDPTSVTLTVGQTLVPAVLGYATNFDGLAAVTYKSSNTDLATVDENGEVSLVADATGTTTITATFAGNDNYLAGNASYTITVNEVGDNLDGNWVLASQADIKAGVKIIIEGANDADIYTMGKQNTNPNRAAIVSMITNGVLKPGKGTKVFTLVNAGDGKFAIQASNGNYLSSATSGTSNNLIEAANYENDNAKWAIAPTSVVAAAGSKTVMQYNSGSTLFSCYGSATQKPVNIYVNKKEINSDVDAADIPTGSNVIMEDGAVLTVDAPKTLGDVKVSEQTVINVNKPLTVQTFTFATTIGGTGESGEANVDVANGGAIIADIYQMDVRLAPENGPRPSGRWHAFTVPFPVDALNGVYDTLDNKLQNEVNYAIMSYHGDVRAQGLYGWKKFRGIMSPGTFYLLTVDGDEKVLRFKKTADGAVVASNNIVLTHHTGSGDATKDHGWNGVGNPNLFGGYAGANVQVLNDEGDGFVPYTPNEEKFAAGIPFFVKVSQDSAMSMAATPSSSVIARTRTDVIKNVKITFGNDAYMDKLYISASEDALNQYEEGKDLVKMTMSNTPSVAQIFGNAYGNKLCMVNAPMANDQAEYGLTLYAPNAGEYTISAPEMENADIFLTYEGSIIWNLSMSEYTNDFAKGNNEGYGLILVKKAPQVVTGVDNAEANEAGVQKVIINKHVYILRAEQMYDVTGKVVK